MLKRLALTVMAVCCLFEVVVSRPAEEHDERQVIMELPVQTQIITLKPGNYVPPTDEPKKDNTREIIEKIKQINQNLKKPHRKHYYTYQKYLGPTGPRDIVFNSYDGFQHTEPVKYSTAELLEKISQVNEIQKKKNNFNDKPKATSQFLQNTPEDRDDFVAFHEGDMDVELSPINESYDNLIYNTRTKRSNKDKLISYLLQNPTSFDEEPLGYTAPSTDLRNEHAPIVVLPKYIMVPINTNNQNTPNQALPLSGYGNGATLKQFPGLPTIPWPLAQYFPILIKDPFLALLHGGGLNNIIEYGPESDVCKKRLSKTSTVGQDKNIIEENSIENVINYRRSGRGMKLRRNVSTNKENSTNLIPTHKKSKKSTIGLKKPIKVNYQTTQAPESLSDEYDKEEKNDEDGDLRFSEFGFFGNKKPPIPSPGFFIGRLKVRRGGVAIAGPGGVATAGRGGTAIVGPGGLALTQPGGLAVAGPSARVVALSSDVDLNKLVALLRNQQKNKQAGIEEDESTPRHLDSVPGGKVVATGPVIYYHEPEHEQSERKN